ALPCQAVFWHTDTARTPPYTLPLHDALPILCQRHPAAAAERTLLEHGRASQRPQSAAAVDDADPDRVAARALAGVDEGPVAAVRSEEHTSELQSRENLVCRLLLEKKKELLPQYACEVLYGINPENSKQSCDVSEEIARCIDESHMEQYTTRLGKTRVCGFSHLHGY